MFRVLMKRKVLQNYCYVQVFLVLAAFCRVFTIVNAQRRPVQAISSLNEIRRNASASRFIGNIHFHYYNDIGLPEKTFTLADENDFAERNCSQSSHFAILLHGWTESCNQIWMLDLVRNLVKHRGGCIICMDYSRYSIMDYGRLVRSFDNIVQVLTGKLFQMEVQGFDPNKGYVFGFSFGAQLALEAGKRFGAGKLKEMDLCEPAGPGFDYRAPFPEHRLAAQNVQCIHTSADKGTRHTSSCHQNWKLGFCGQNQIAAGAPPLGSHGLCPYFYNAAFDYDFLAVPKPPECRARRVATSWPEGFKMGYMEQRKGLVNGELFAPTTYSFPWTPVPVTKLVTVENITEADLRDDLQIGHVPLNEVERN